MNVTRPMTRMIGTSVEASNYEWRQYMGREQMKDLICAIVTGAGVTAGLMTSGIMSAVLFGVAALAFTLTQMVVN